jgi:hypothetical protein
MLPEPHASASSRTLNAWIDQLDPGILKSGNQLHERINVGSNNAVTGLHTLYGGHRKIGQIGGLALIDIQQRASSPQLIGSNH